MSESNQPNSNNNNNRSNNRNRRRRPNRNPNNKGPNPNNPNQQQKPQGNAPAPQNNNQQAQAQNPNNGGGGQKKFNNRNRNRNRNNAQAPRPKLSPEEHAFYKYEELREAHVDARAKYFEVFDRKDINLRNKWERLFNESLTKLRDYEAGLTNEQKDYIEKKVDGLAPDRIYTQNHGIDIHGVVEVTEEQIECPHLLRSQIESNFKEDEEESVGTYEDYLAYKGL